MRISVVTVAFNSERTLARTIESVLAQDYPDVEYLVIDGASRDGTVGIAESYRPKFEAKGWTYVVRSEPDRGIYDAMNKGVALATGDIIGQINSDDWYEPGAFRKVAEVYERTGFDLFWADLRIVKRTGNLIKRARRSDYLTTRHWNHPTTFLRASVYKANPYALESIADDWDLILRLRGKGVHVEVLNEVLANFSFGGVSTDNDFRKTLAAIRLTNSIYRKNGFRNPLYFLETAVIKLLKWGLK